MSIATKREREKKKIYSHLSQIKWRSKGVPGSAGMVAVTETQLRARGVPEGLALARNPPGMALMSATLPLGVNDPLKIGVIDQSGKNPPPRSQDQT